MYSLDFYMQWFFGFFLIFYLAYLLLKYISTDLKRGRITPYTGFSLGYLFFMLGPLLILHFQGYYDKPVLKELIAIPDLDINTAFFSTIYVFICGLIIAWMHRYFGREALFKKKIQNVNNYYFRYLIIVSTFYLVFITYDVLISGLLSGDGHWYYSRQEAMAGSQISVLIVYIKHALQLFVLAILLHGFDRAYLRESVFFLLLLTFLTISVYLSGNRFGIALSGITLVLLFIKKRRYLPVILLSILGIPVAWFGTMFMWVRGIMHEHGGGVFGMFDLMLDAKADADTQFLSLLTNVFEGVNFNVLNAVLRDFPAKLDFLYGATFIKPLVSFIPRSVWADKPERLSQILGMEYAGDDQLALVSTYPGELWANFGYLSFIAIILLSLLFIRFLQFAFHRYEFGWCIIFFYAFTMSRASYGGTLIEICIAATLMFLLSKLVQAKFIWGGR